MTVGEAKRELTRQLQVCSESAAFEAAELLYWATGVPHGHLPLARERVLSAAEARALRIAVRRRRRGVPLQYILGKWEFFGLPFYVGRGVLIPRSDTEQLVEPVLKYLQTLPEARLFDLCAGSGAIGIALAANTPQVRLTLVEKSRRAMRYLRKNLQLNQISAAVCRADVLRWAPPARADVIVSNPPYIRADEIHNLSREVRHEPRMALAGGRDGLDFYRALCGRMQILLKPGGRLYFEIGYDEASAVTRLLQEGGFEDISQLKDLQGKDRVIFGTYRPDGACKNV